MPRFLTVPAYSQQFDGLPHSGATVLTSINVDHVVSYEHVRPLYQDWPCTRIHMTGGRIINARIDSELFAKQIA